MPAWIRPNIWQARLMGAKAKNLLASPAFSGKVLAVLSTTVYLLGDDGEMIWVAMEEVPLHRRCLRASFPPGALRVGQVFFTQNGFLRIGQDAAIELDQAIEWEPSAVKPEQAESLPVVNSCLQRLLDFLPEPGKGAGLGQAVALISAIAGGRDVTGHPLDSVFARAFRPILDIAKAALGQDMAEVASKGRELVGLGPGLTPSGDDFLGGLLFAAHSLKTAYPGDFCWGREVLTDLTGWARKQTHSIGHTVLCDLALGHGPEPLHEVIKYLLTSQDLRCLMASVTRLLEIGHTTGWDILAGALTGMLLVKGRLNRFRGPAVPDSEVSGFGL
jgi:hypothetical protein